LKAKRLEEAHCLTVLVKPARSLSLSVKRLRRGAHFGDLKQKSRPKAAFAKS